MARQRYGKRNKSKNLTWILILGFVLVGLWLLLSIWNGINPLQVFSGISGDGQDQESQPITYDSLMTLYTHEQQQRIELSKEVKAFQGHAATQTVNMDSGTLNMRSAASTSADVLNMIPTGQSVIVYYCKQDSSLLDGKMGTWCKVNYQNNEGWVWSEYIN